MHAYLSGPVSLDEFYNPSNGHHLYVFGDWHFLQSKCNDNAPKISQFIEETILANKKKEIHLFLETEHLSKAVPKNPYLNGRKVDTYIGDIVSHFPFCFNGLKSKPCKNYSKFTIHAIDFRITQPTPAVFLLNNLVDIRKNASVKGILKKNISRVISQIESSVEDNILDLMVYLYDIHDEMKKGISNTPSISQNDIKNFLLYHIDDEDLPHDKNSLLDMFSYALDLINDNEIKKLSKLMEDFELLSNHVLNYYILCLVFSGTLYNMIYVGEAHAHVISSFLQHTKQFEHLFSSWSCANATCYQCLNIEDLQQPLFQ